MKKLDLLIDILNEFYSIDFSQCTDIEETSIRVYDFYCGYNKDWDVYYVQKPFNTGFTLFYGGYDDKEFQISDQYGEIIFSMFINRSKYVPTKDQLLFTLEYGRANLDNIELEFLESILKDIKIFKIDFLKFIGEHKQKML